MYFLLEWNHQWNCASTKEESKSYCGMQMQGMCDDKKVYQRTGESWAGVRVLLLDVLQKATHY
jgi:hypothetical protein